MSEDPGELERFYDETVAPLSAYDEQYETDLVKTIEAYLDNDGNVTPTADQLFTHRHTVRYRLERVKELCGHDITSTEGREKLGLGLKAMRVLGHPAARAARRSSPAPRRGGRRCAARPPTTEDVLRCQAPILSRGYRPAARWGVVQWHDAGFWCREIQVRILAPQSLRPPRHEHRGQIGDDGQGRIEHLPRRIAERNPAELTHLRLASAIALLSIAGPVPAIAVELGDDPLGPPHRIDLHPAIGAGRAPEIGSAGAPDDTNELLLQLGVGHRVEPLAAIEQATDSRGPRVGWDARSRRVELPPGHAIAGDRLVDEALEVSG